MHVSSQCQLCESVIILQNIYEPFNQNNSVPTGSSWLQERQIRICHKSLQCRLCASGQVLLGGSVTRLSIMGWSLYVASVFTQCSARYGSEQIGILPICSKQIGKSQRLKSLHRRSCKKNVYQAVEIACIHRCPYEIALDLSYRPCIFLRDCASWQQELKKEPVAKPLLHPSRENHWIHHCPPL